MYSNTLNKNLYVSQRNYNLSNALAEVALFSHLQNIAVNPIKTYDVSLLSDMQV